MDTERLTELKMQRDALKYGLFQDHYREGLIAKYAPGYGFGGEGYRRAIETVCSMIEREEGAKPALDTGSNTFGYLKETPSTHLESEIANLKEENLKLMDSVRDYRSKVGELQEENSGLRGGKEILEARIDTLRSHLTDWQKKVKELEERNKNQQRDIIRNQSDRAAMHREIEALKEEVEQLRFQNEGIAELTHERDRYKKLQPWCLKDRYGKLYKHPTAGMSLFASKAEADELRSRTVSPDYWTPVLWDGDPISAPDRAVPGKAWCLKWDNSLSIHKYGFDPVIFPTKTKALEYRKLHLENDERWHAVIWE